MAAEPADTPAPDWTIDELTARSGVPVRTIREYQRLGLLPAPRRMGRVGLYDTGHLHRLDLIDRLQTRGYSLAGIGDLLSAWRDGDALGDVLGLEPDQLVHVDEPGAPASRAQLAEVLPTLVPDRLDDLIATGVVEHCGPDRYCVPSPSLLQLTIDILGAGVDVEATLALLRVIDGAADGVARAVRDTVAQLPDTADDDAVATLVGRGRGLLAHGMGRLTIHHLGRLVGATDDETVADLTRRMRTPDQ